MILLQLVACASDYGLRSIDPSGAAAGGAEVADAPAMGRPAAGDALAEEPPVHRPVPPGRHGAVSATEDGHGGRREVFELGADRATAQVDWLFVLDGSSSMTGVVDRVRAAFGGLAEEGVFPPESRVAVLSTTPAATSGSRPGRLHSAVRKTPGAEHEPGFGHLVSRERIAAYRSAAPERAAAFPADGCGEWFAPTERNAEGVPCFLANTQISGAPVRAEAGLVALGQWLSTTSEPFRPGAAVNVIFVSDTHDPGTDHPKADDLRSTRPSADTLRSLAERTEPLAAFRLHAIAPATECVEAWPDGPTYAQAAADSGGWTLDLCTATDYRPLVRRIAGDGALPDQPALRLGVPARDVTDVRVGGEPVGFSVSESGRALLLERLPAKGVRVEVEYQRLPARGAVRK